MLTDATTRPTIWSVPNPGGPPLVSILIPTHNRVEKLRVALDSALAQTYRPIEVVVSDNASSDTTQDTCEAYAQDHPEIRYFRQAENLGATRNFEWLRGTARGEFLMFLADDDWIDPDYVSACLDAFNDRPQSSLVAGDAVYSRPDGTQHTEPPMHLDSPNPTRRVRDYYRRVRANGVFYGLIRQSYDARTEPMQHQLAADWLRVASLAFMGEVHTVHAKLHRTIPETYDLGVIVRSLGLDGFQAAVPQVAIGCRVFTATAQSDTYAPLGPAGRLLLATQCAAILLTRFGVSTARRVVSGVEGWLRPGARQ